MSARFTTSPFDCPEVNPNNEDGFNVWWSPYGPVLGAVTQKEWDTNVGKIASSNPTGE